MPDENRRSHREERRPPLVDPRQGLWHLLPSPLIAAAHFATCSIGTSVYCLRSETGLLLDARIALASLTVAAVASIAVCAVTAWRRLRLVARSEDGDPKRRSEERFLARITLYLANLSWVGVLFVAAPLAFFGSCA